MCCEPARHAKLRDGGSTNMGVDPNQIVDSLQQSGFVAAEPANCFQSMWWFDCLARHTFEAHEDVYIVSAPADSWDNASALLFMRSPYAQPGSIVHKLGFTPRSATLASLHNHQSCSFGPVMSKLGEPSSRLFRHLASRIRESSPDTQVVDINLLEKDSVMFNAFVSGLESSRMKVIPYNYKGCWHEPRAERSFKEYLQDRDKKTRKTWQNYARKQRQLERSENLTFELYTEVDDHIIEQYREVERLSWKDPEPSPEFVPAVMREASRHGNLRLGIVRLNDKPVAVELVLATKGTATMFKTHYDSAHQKKSVGAIAIYRTLEYLLDVDQCESVDFGTDDDPYKATWVENRRLLSGMLAVDLRSWRGLEVGTRFKAWEKQQSLRQIAKRLLRRG